MSDSLTLSQVEDALHRHGYKFKRSGDTVMAQCPRHDGGDLNCQVNSNGYCTCYSQCGEGFWLDEVFDELRDPKYKKGESMAEYKPPRKEKPKYVTRDYYSLWEGLPKLSTRLSEPLKGVLPLDTLDDLGWRWIENGPYGLGTGVFIPYWDSSFDRKDGEALYPKRLNFCQVRHLDGPVRFNFPKDAEPTIYGSWMLRDILGDEMPLFICEGTSDWVTLWENCVPAIAMPSCSATALLSKAASWCKDNGIALVYAGDNDSAGDKLRQALDDDGHSYRVCQPPKEYNDWTDFYISKGDRGVFEYVKHLVFPDTEVSDDQQSEHVTSGTAERPDGLHEADELQTVMELFPGAVELEIEK